MLMAVAAALVAVVMFFVLAARAGEVTTLSGGAGGSSVTGRANAPAAAQALPSEAITHPFTPLISGVRSPFALR
jgi:hypothetical protein